MDETTSHTTGSDDHPDDMPAAPYRPTITCQRDLEQVWRHLMQPPRFGGHSLWLMFIDGDGRAVPSLTEITHAVEPLDADQQASLGDFLRHVLVEAEPGSRVAFLRSRPGRGVVGSDDRAFAASLYAACRAADVPAEVVHLATKDGVLPLPVDEVLPRSA